MSQIASAYTLSTSLLDRVADLAIQGAYELFWETLWAQAAEVTPEYPYSGYPVIVTLACLEESGLNQPMNLEHSGAQAITDTDMGLVLCARRSDAEVALALLDSFIFSTDTLQQFFEEFTQESWPEAGVAMQEAVAFLRRGLAQLQNRDEWLIVFVG